MRPVEVSKDRVGGQASSRESRPPVRGGAFGSAWLPGVLSARRFMAVFISVVLLFTVTTAYSQYIQRTSHRAALDIAFNGAPSIEHLGKARGELRRLEVLLEDRVLSGGDVRSTLDEVARVRARFRTEVDAYLATPAFPGELELWQQVAEDIKAIDAIVDEILATFAQEHGQRAVDLLRGRLIPAADLEAEAIGRSVEFNAAHVSRLAESIEVNRSRSALLAGAFDALGAVLTILAGYLLFRGVRQHVTLLEAHDELMQRRADELEQFAGRVAHDILSPMSAAAMALATAERGLPEGHRARTSTARGLRSLMRVQRIVAGLLEFAKAGAQPALGAYTEVGPIVDDVVGEVRVIAEEAGIEVIVEPFEPCVVACRDGILTSLLANLLRNAVKYMGDELERRVCVRVHDRGKTVRIEVEDTGPGIPAHLQPHIFEPYFRGTPSAQPGIGLGLATVKRITQTHGGALGVVSAPGRGCVFWFELPKPPASSGAAVVAA